MFKFVEETINEFNDWYEYERYIFKNPKSLDLIFDDLTLTEIFVPSIEAKRDKEGRVADKVEYHTDEIYIKLRLDNGTEFRMSFDDLSDTNQEYICQLLVEDFGQYEWECLYVDHGDGEPDLKIVMDEQRRLIKEKYGEDVKEWFCEWIEEDENEDDESK